MADARTRTIKADYLARVEGEGAMYVRLRGDEVLDVKLRIYEPPRFFEAFLRGRSFMEATDITARICGICPVAYQTSAAQALEDACGATVDGQLRALRRLIYCGEWIESHGLHVYMLHAPDFMGYASAMEMARDHPEIVERGLRIEEGRQRADRAGGRARGASHQRPARRLLPRSDQSRVATARRPARAGPRGRARDGSLGGGARLSRPRARPRGGGTALRRRRVPDR